MEFFTYTLLSDGSSDETLLPIIDWAITAHRPNFGITSNFAKNLGKVGSDLPSRIKATLKIYPCDLLFIHRDAEKETYSKRQAEINAACRGISNPYIPIVPLRMTEAWLLSDEMAIRGAAGNRLGTAALQIPSRKQWETNADPKLVLFNALKIATEKSGRALKRAAPEQQRYRVAQLTKDFSKLRGLTSFDAFEQAIRSHLP